MKKILVVDDDSDIRANLTDLLEAESFKVNFAENGAEALEKVISFSPDLILSDIMMPTMNGFDFLNILQNNQFTSSIPVIFLSAKTAHRDLRRGMEMGADDFITKPFKADEVISAIRTRLRKREHLERKYHNLKTSITNYLPHEFRTPLVSILGFSELIKTNFHDFDEKTILEMIDKIHKSGKRLHDRIEKFLLLSDLEVMRHENKIIREFTVKPNSIVSLIFDRFSTESLVRLDVGLTNGKVIINGELFVWIIMELIENAIKFSIPDSKIIIASSIAGLRYKLEVTNYGQGLSKEDMERIDAFTQFSRENNQQVGNGLGLYLIRKILKYVNGKFNIESLENDKTTVAVEFPISQ